MQTTNRRKANTAKHTADMILVAQVFESGSITAACESTGLERTSISRRLGALESRVGVPLFDRSGNRIRPTAAGNTFLGYCRRVRELVLELDSVMSGRLEQTSRILTVKADFDEAIELLAPAIRLFLKNHSDADVTFTQLDHPVSAVPDDTDLILQLDSPRQPDAETHLVATLSRSIWGSPGLLNDDLPVVSPHELSRFSIIGVAGPEDAERTWHLKRNDQTVNLHIVERLRYPSMADCRDACIAGLGIAMLPDYLAVGALESGRLVRIAADWSTSGIPLTASHPRSLRTASQVCSLIEFLTEHGCEV